MELRGARFKKARGKRKSQHFSKERDQSLMVLPKARPIKDESALRKARLVGSYGGEKKNKEWAHLFGKGISILLS